ncbi:MAG: HPr family phosphocarrier protein [Planctomycetes bacterium]|nr:HPr family phosphocarrier protein [Planctomycetota bacterium]
MSKELARTIPITHKYGLHARASTVFVQRAQDFASQVYMSRDAGEEVDAKSVLQLLTLGVQQGDQVTLRIIGDDAEQAMDVLSDLIKRDFFGV